MNFVDQIYLINLDRRPDRLKASQDQFNHHNLTVEKVPAIDGSKLPPEHLREMKPGVIGCMLSHRCIIEDAKYKGLEAVMVFEDDVELHPGFLPLLKDSIRDLPCDWDMLYLGGSHQENPTPITGKIYKVHKTLTTHAYIMRKSMFGRAIEMINSYTQPVDGIYADLQKEFNCFVTNPPLAWQREDHSDIEGRRMRYDHIKEAIK